MKKPIPKIRVFGQRSIAPSFLNRTPVPVEESPSKEVEKCASFSAFLDRKLNKSLVSKPNNVEEGPRPFTSLLCSKDLSHGFGEKEKKNGLEKAMLQQFKPRETRISEQVTRDITALEPLVQTTAEDMDNMTSCPPEITEEGIIVKDDKLSRKRKDPFEGMESINRSGKPVIVFGDNSKASETLESEGERTSNNGSKRRRPTYNHYANGSGWWDCDMEGVDSEEVGHSEVWEGVGSTTYGDIVDWH